MQDMILDAIEIVDMLLRIEDGIFVLIMQGQF